MSSRPFSRKVAVLVVFAILALPWVSAAGPRQEEVRPSLLEQVWSFLTSAWSESGIDQPEPPPIMDEGCRIDPNGGCSS
ncbi:MAG: hypothetical protein ACJ76J_10525 [Thermoanaerobaculia bacterium]